MDYENSITIVMWDFELHDGSFSDNIKFYVFDLKMGIK